MSAVLVRHRNETQLGIVFVERDRLPNEDRRYVETLCDLLGHELEPEIALDDGVDLRAVGQRVVISVRWADQGSRGHLEGARVALSEPPDEVGHRNPLEHHAYRFAQTARVRQRYNVLESMLE